MDFIMCVYIRFTTHAAIYVRCVSCVCMCVWCVASVYMYTHSKHVYTCILVYTYLHVHDINGCEYTQNTLKRLGVNNIPGIEEVNLFRDDGSVVHFKNPKV